MAAMRKKNTREQDEVFIMEAKLKLLKDQMEAERQKREDMVKRNGSANSIWMNGRTGPMRGLRDVRAMVRSNARERAARPPSATSAADTATPSPTELDENNTCNNRLWSPGPGKAGWTPAQRNVDGTSCGPDAPPSPPAVNGSTLRPATAPQEPIEVAAMECQTEPVSSGRSRWSGKGSGSRPATGAKRAVATTYLGKILEARKQQHQK